ncbi:MAG: ATP-dependent DNA helicase RecG [Clostridia bacterium]|nr:ATP-dependent DNA helicase RecG [Clostridia bacterium]
MAVGSAVEKLNMPVTAAKGVGPARAAAFSRVGVTTVGDLLRYYPRAYQNREHVRTLAEIRGSINAGGTGRSEPVSSVLAVASEPMSRMIRRGMTITKIRLFDETGTCEATFFNQPYVRDNFRTGAQFRIWGRFELEKSRLTINSPVWEPYVEGGDLLPIVPVYPLTRGLTQKAVAQSVAAAISMTGGGGEYLPEEVLSRLSLPTHSYAVRNIHFPESVEALGAAKDRLSFDELLLTSLSLSVSGGRRNELSKTVVPKTDTAPFTGAIPFTLTASQKRAIAEIGADLSGGKVMNRILVGDVGSGKTVVAAAAAYFTMKAGYSVALMAPTEILATQHFSDLSALFDRLGYKCFLLTGSTGAAKRREISAAIADGSVPVLLIGTHALISPDVTFSRLGLAIIDEQHRFGVMQRAALAEKTEGVHTLVMSATPIPRTLSLIAYGNLDVSRLDELPSGRQPVDTFAVDESYRKRLNAFIEKQVGEGHQVYVVCPAVEESPVPEKGDDPLEMADISLFDLIGPDPELPMKSAVEYSERLKNELKNCRVSFVHGRMKPAEKDAVMTAFARGEIDVLVSTTVIEVGVNVPNATLMIVENAERFGLSQLHQLRGRVGRGPAKSYFVMVSDSKGEKAKDRIETLKRSRDGYKIAEADLRQRGPGDILSENSVVRQHGQSTLSLIRALSDSAITDKVTECVTRILGDDPTLEKPENEKLRDRVLAMAKRSSGTVN